VWLRGWGWRLIAGLALPCVLCSALLAMLCHGIAGYSLAILLYLALMVFAAQAAADSL
jgi:hypothetical protein